MSTYIALIRKEKGLVFGVEFPDFPRCISAGETLDKAVAGAKNALKFHVEGMLADGDAVPVPGGLEDIRKLPEFKGTVPVLIDLERTSAHRTIRRPPRPGPPVRPAPGVPYLHPFRYGSRLDKPLVNRHHRKHRVNSRNQSGCSRDREHFDLVR